ncbi:MAG: type I phosphomannose isomerase catalytic subunit [Candidatus Izemoplasma sp.]|nr:type I phosphomannose isomerase catalytic subunit [Candidatus Izemoplasma sp.]
MIEMIPYVEDKLWGKELWFVSDFKKKVSKVVYQGRIYSFKRFYREHNALFGNMSEPTYPIIIKQIIADDKLSIQVHPPKDIADKYGHDSKVESWIILKNTVNDTIVYGHHAENKHSLNDFMNNQAYDRLIQRISIKPYDILTIYPGTLHAICEKTSVLEIQQASDTTYRVYDYNRLYQGHKRKIHTKQAYESIKVPNKTVYRDQKTPYYQFNHIKVSAMIKSTSDQTGTFIYVAEGSGKLNSDTVKEHHCYFVPSKTVYKLSGPMDCIIIHL